MRSFLSRARDAALGIFAVTNTARAGDPLVSHYDRLEAYYLNSGVYDRLANLTENGVEIQNTVALRALRNPANRVTEFYAAKLEPSGWLDEAEFGDSAKAQEEGLKAALRSIQASSNWQAEGRTAARQFAWAGDLFVKVSSRHVDPDDPTSEAKSVFYERIDPRYVKDFDKDERGFFTYLRISVPKTRRLEDNPNETEDYTQTEIWDKERRRYFVYEHDDSGASGASLDNLGEPVLEQALTTEPSSAAPDGFTGYDFVPVIHAKFRDVGKERGLPCFGHALGMIRECDRIATKLHEMLFPDETWVLTRSGIGPDGNPLPPIEFEDNRTDPLDSLPTGQYWARGYDRTTYAQGDTVAVGGSRITRLPTGGNLEPKIPNRNMAPALEALAEQVKALEADLPETAYSKLRELELSGRAIRYSLDDVYSRFNEAFANFAGAIVRLENMALTVGQVLNLPGFSEAEIGTYGESGEGFEHSYPTPDPFPSSRQDDADADLTEAQGLAAFKALGAEPYRRALVEAGWTEEEAAAEAATMQQQQASLASLGATQIPPDTIARTQAIFERQFGANGPPDQPEP